MRQRSQKVRFWIILTTVNIVAMIYPVDRTFRPMTTMRSSPQPSFCLALHFCWQSPTPSAPSSLTYSDSCRRKSAGYPATS
jgi:hypothetical protein